MSRYLYAAYGSNLHPMRLRQRAPSAELLGTGLLPGFALAFHKRGFADGSGKCNIPAGGDGVHVAVYAILNAERAGLDRTEGVGYGYEVHEVEVGEFGSCSIYIAGEDAIDESLQPLDWYREYVRIGAHYQGFPAEYVAAIANLEAIEDADRERAAREWTLLGEITNDPGFK